MLRPSRLAWTQSGWLSDPQVVRWEPLDRHRAAHEKAVAAFEAVKGEDDTEALLALCDVVEQAVRELVEKFDDATEGWKAAYREVGVELEPFAEGLRLVATAGPAHESWIKRAEENGEGDLVEPARRRKALRDDGETLGRLVHGALRPAEILRAGPFAPAATTEARDLREQLAAPTETEAA